MTVKDEIRSIANQHAALLEEKMETRVKEMEEDDNSHFLIYRVLGVTIQEGHQIDIYQNKGRFLYRYAGSFLEEVTKYCYKSRYPNADSIRIPNTHGTRPKTFEIDCLVDTDAIEIKWRDATTDGDHITKEHTRIQTISDAGYTPIRVMYYYPNRKQAIRIQRTLETLYEGLKGHYYWGEAAWDHVQNSTGIALKEILEDLANERDHSLAI